MNSNIGLSYLSLDLEKIICELSSESNNDEIKKRWIIGRRLKQENILLKDMVDILKNKKEASYYLYSKYGEGYDLCSLCQYELFYDQHLNLDKCFQSTLLSWNCYLLLMKVRSDKERILYEKEALQNQWNETQLYQVIQQKRPTKNFHRSIDYFCK